MKGLDANDRYAMSLLLVFAAVFAVLAWDPWYRSDWLLENVILFVLLPPLLLMHRFLPLSRVSYTLVFVFLCFHEIGAHYTYAEVPYDRWFQALVGVKFNELVGWQRNHYDRIVHFLWGLLLTYPVREIFLRVSRARGFWSYLFPFLVAISTSTIFELFEWGAALIFGGDLGIAYLGTQGDEWDAQKDMVLALAGSLLAILGIAGFNAVFDRDFAREWSDSLRVKRREPLGEYEISRLLRGRNR